MYACMYVCTMYVRMFGALLASGMLWMCTGVHVYRVTV